MVTQKITVVHPRTGERVSLPLLEKGKRKTLIFYHIATDTVAICNENKRVLEVLSKKEYDTLPK